MSSETITRSTRDGTPVEARDDASGEHVTVIKTESSSSGLGIIAVLLVIAALVAVAFVWIGNKNDSNDAITSASEAVTDASQAVGSAADKVGDAAENTANNAN